MGAGIGKQVGGFCGNQRDFAGLIEAECGALLTPVHRKRREPSQLLGGEIDCMDRMSMKKGKEPAAQAGDPHQHGKKQN